MRSNPCLRGTGVRNRTRSMAWPGSAATPAESRKRRGTKRKPPAATSTAPDISFSQAQARAPASLSGARHAGNSPRVCPQLRAPIKTGDRSRDRPRNGGNRGADLFRRVITAESEADALAAHIGDDLCAHEPIMDRLRARQFEGEEMA